jgi:outer membrane receptor protein involved in Fe transport
MHGFGWSSGVWALMAGAAVAQTPDPNHSGKATTLDEVVVTATRTETRLLDVPASVVSREMDTLRLSGFTYGTDEFRGVPGVFFRRGEGDGDEFAFVSIRGSSGTEGYLAMVDGVPFFGPDEEPLLSQVPYDALERVEIVKGPVSALYGRGGLYGAVNYITRSPREDLNRLSVSVGSDDYYRAEATGSRRLSRGGVLFSLSREDYGGWREQSRKQVTNLFGRFDHDLSDRTVLEGSLNLSDRDSEVPNAIPATREGAPLPVIGGARTFLGYGDPRNRTEGAIGSLRLTHAASDRLSISGVIQARRFDQDLRLNFYDPFATDASRNIAGYNGFFAQSRHEVLFGEATLNWQGDRHQVVAGVSAENSRSRGLDSWTGQNGFTFACGFTFYAIEVDYTTGRTVNAGHPCFVTDEPLTRDRFEDRFWGAFVQDEIRLSERWRLTLGLRYDSFERNALIASPPTSPEGRLTGSADAFSPKAALSYRYDGGLVYFAYGRGFSSNFGTTFEWDAAQYARPENRPSTLDSYELGWKGRALDNRLRFEAAVFHTEQTNRRLIVPNPAAATDFTAPGSLVTFGSLYRSRGAELSLQFEPREGTTLTAQYTWLDPEWGDYVIQSAFGPPLNLTGRTPTGVAEDIIHLAAEHAFTPWLSARASYERYGDYAVTQDNRIVDGGYELVTMGARIAPPSWRDVTLDLSVNNLLDEDYVFFFGGRTNVNYLTPGVPRQVRMTLRTSF